MTAEDAIATLHRHTARQRSRQEDARRSAAWAHVFRIMGVSRDALGIDREASATNAAVEYARHHPFPSLMRWPDQVTWRAVGPIRTGDAVKVISPGVVSAVDW